MDKQVDKKAELRAKLRGRIEAKRLQRSSKEEKDAYIDKEAKKMGIDRATLDEFMKATAKATAKAGKKPLEA